MSISPTKSLLQTATRSGLIIACFSLLLPRPAAVEAADAPAAKSPPNIIFFLSDDQRWDQLGCAGHPILKTPNIDRLARHGVRFRNAFVTTSICAASRASIFTGLYERTHRYTFRTPPLAARFVDDSYPVRLRQAGYRTGFIGKFGVGVPRDGVRKMFDDFFPIGRAPYFKKMPDGSLRHETELCGDRAIELIDKYASSGHPFCISVSFNAGHAEDGDKQHHFPWPKSVDGLYEEVDVPQPRLSDRAVFESQPEFLKRSLNRVRWYWRWDTPEKYDRNMRAYWRMLSGIDHVVGRVAKKLEQAGIADNTVLIYCGDNGYYMGQRGFAGKWSHYEESLRVPLILFDPRQQNKSPDGCDAMALNIDVAPTILDLAGVEIPAACQGKSLVPWLAGDEPANWRTEFFCEHLMHYPTRIPKWEGIRTERFKYARYFEQYPMFEFLHDLKEDPDERKNLATDPARKELLERMRRACDRLRDAAGGPYREEESASASAAPPARKRPARKKQGAKEKAGGNRSAPSRRPNVVMIISDDQAWTDFGFMGHPVIKTPHLDRLARSSLTFTRGYVPTALCRPSLATMITGLYPHQHGITGNDPAIPTGIPPRRARRDPKYLELVHKLNRRITRLETLPRILGRHGYVSFQSGKWWEGNYKNGGFTHGMTHGDVSRGGRHGDEGLKIGRDGMKPIFDFIDSAGDRPFFLWYAPFLPHQPHNPPERLLAKYRKPGRSIELAKYYAMCDWFDETCGQLLGYLDQKGLRKNTLVVFVVDNGWIQREPQTKLPGPWRHGFAPKSKQSPYDGGVRTPIMVQLPGKVRPRFHPALASSVDLAPTILELCGVDVPKGLPGQSLVSMVQGDSWRDRRLFGESYAHDIPDLDDHSVGLLYRWCIEGDWKLIVKYPGSKGRSHLVHDWMVKEPELYDLIADPHEETNRIRQYPEVVGRLKSAIDAIEIGSAKQ